jgi:hypothetical protein
MGDVMQLCDVREWRHQGWTHLYELALFEPDMVKLCACVWDAELAILSRQNEIRRNSPGNLREQLALRKALGVLSELTRLSGFANHQPSIQPRIIPGAAQMRVHRGARAAKRVVTPI